MQQELDREKAALLLPGMQRPYFIEYRLDDIHTFEAIANYGALTREEENHQRLVRVTVRIGSYDSDSSSSRGDGSVQLAPADNSKNAPAALRYALWTATDEAYKNALRAYSTKQATLKRFESKQTEQDFSEAKPVTAIEPLVSLEIDRPEWKRRIVESSGLFLSDQSVSSNASHIDFSTANVRGIAVNRFLVNTEGTTLRHGYTGYTASISVGAQAEDGMRLSRDNGTTAAKASELESAEAFHNRAITDLKSLRSPTQRALGLLRGLPRPRPLLRRRLRRRPQPPLRPQHRGRPPRDGHHRPHPGRLHLQLQVPRPARDLFRHRRPAPEDLRRPHPARRLHH